MERTLLLQIVGLSGVGIVVLAWLVASFAAPGLGRQRAARVGACGLYLALCALFSHLSLQAWESGSWLVLAAFGLLLFVFGGGLGVSVVKTLALFRPSRRSASHATH